MARTSESHRLSPGLGLLPRRILTILMHGACAIALFVVNVRMAYEPIRLGHDASWRKAYAYFFTERFQAGVDYVFTLGPDFFNGRHFHVVCSACRACEDLAGRYRCIWPCPVHPSFRWAWGVPFRCTCRDDCSRDAAVSRALGGAVAR